MALMQWPHIIYSIFCLISIFICYTLKTWSSSNPTNWPLLGMAPSLLHNFNCINEYITNILKHNGGTFMFKGPWFSGTDMLVTTSDPANFRHISTNNFHNYPKGPKSREIFDILGDGIFNSDSNLWELHRKTTISLLKHAKLLTLLEKRIWNNMQRKLMPVLDFKAERGSKIDLQEIFQRLTFDSIISLLVAYDPETLSIDFSYNKFEKAFTKSEEALFNRHFLPKFCWKLLKKLRIGNETYLSDAKRLSDELLYKFIKEKRQKGNNGLSLGNGQEEDLSLLTGFMREYKDETGTFGNPDMFIKDTIFSLLVAGRDTTSSALTWFFCLVAENHEVEGKIREEIHAKLGMKEGEKWKGFGRKELEKLVFLQAAIYEALRLFPSFPANQKISLEADTLPSGHQILKNTKIILHSYAMGRLETIWGNDCLEFKPERWLSEKGEIKHVPSYHFTAFHTGPRACIGKEILLIQMKIVATTIIYNYNIKLVEDHSNIQNATVFVQLKYGLMVKVIKRNEVNREDQMRGIPWELRI